MNFEFTPKWVGKWQVVVRDKDGNIIDQGIKPNLITDDGLDLFRDVLSGAVGDGEIKYIALGTGTAAATVSDSTLGSEQFRKAVTSQTNQAGAGILLTITSIIDSEANGFETQEIGWFATTAATTAANTGVMIARVLYNRQKTSLESWNVNRTDTLARG